MIRVYCMTSNHPHAFGGLIEVCDIIPSTSTVADIKRKCESISATRVRVIVHDRSGFGHTTTDFDCENGKLDARRSGLLRVNGIAPSRKAMYERLGVTLKRLRASK